MAPQDEEKAALAALQAQWLPEDEKLPPATKRSPVRRVVKSVIQLAIIAAVFFAVGFFVSPEKPTGLFPFSGLTAPSASAPEPAAPSASAAPTEVFQVHYPVGVPAGATNTTQVLLSGLADSGELTGTYSAPEVFNFTHALLYLEAEITGNQTSAIADIFFGDLLVWKTATADPQGTAVVYNHTKDVSMLLEWFKSDQEVKLQFSDPLSGSVNVTLTAILYNATAEAAEAKIDSETDFHNYRYSNATPAPPTPSEPVEINYTSIFVPHGPPDVLVPLASGSAVLPALPSNVTRAMLRFYAEPTGSERQYYLHVLDEFKDTFAKFGKSFVGGGPVRSLNVYVDGVFIAAVSPTPLVLNSDFDPRLWSPIVAQQSFDLLAYEVDLTAVLPLLWTGSAELAVEVHQDILKSSFFKPLPGPVPPVGIAPPAPAPWKLSGAVLGWASPYVTASSGIVSASTNTTKPKAFGIAPPFGFSLTEIVTNKISSELVANFTYEFTDGAKLNFSTGYNASAQAVNVQRWFGHGAAGTVTGVSTAHHGFNVTNGTSGELLMAVKGSTKLPLQYKLKETITGSEMNVTIGETFKFSVNGTVEMSIKAKQNATTVLPAGEVANEVKYNATIFSLPPYSRHVEAEDGVLVLDDAGDLVELLWEEQEDAEEETKLEKYLEELWLQLREFVKEEM